MDILYNIKYIEEKGKNIIWNNIKIKGIDIIWNNLYNLGYNNILEKKKNII